MWRHTRWGGGSLGNMATCEGRARGKKIMKFVWLNLWMAPNEYYRINLTKLYRNRTTKPKIEPGTFWSEHNVNPMPSGRTVIILDFTHILVANWQFSFKLEDWFIRRRARVRLGVENCGYMVRKNFARHDIVSSHFDSTLQPIYNPDS